MNDGLGKNWKERLLGILTAHPAVQGVVLFGSRAMGTWKPASDIDLALEGATLDLNDLLQLKASVGELNLPVDVDLLLLDTLKNPDLLRHIDTCGVVWWRRFCMT